ncbi:MAG: GDSL-type esterase/lipase family protein, partial [Deltaproteobacteria bacterium]|nr:GDSL-type esterase/lipase family protein [Deltaproteobacteria bacterium]
SDLYTSTLREALQRGFGNLGRGFTMPVPIYEDYWQAGVRIHPSEGISTLEPSPKRRAPDAYGIAGIAFEARGKARARIQSDGSTFSRLGILYWTQPGGGKLEAEIDGITHTFSTASPSPRPQAHLFALKDSEHDMILRPQGDGPVRLFGLVLEKEGAGVLVDQFGVAGAKARHHLLWQEESWAELLAWRRPDLVLFAYGNNELTEGHVPVETHAQDFERMMRRFRSRFPEIACLVIGPFGATSALVSMNDLVALNRAYRQIAFRFSCGFIDVLRWQGGPGATSRLQRWLPPLARDDGIHFTEAGYRAFGAALTTAILEKARERIAQHTWH